MRNLLTSILNFVSCDRVVQRAYNIQFTESPGVSKPISVPLGGSKKWRFFSTIFCHKPSPAETGQQKN